MKKMKKLLRVLLALTLTFCFLSYGMVVYASSVKDADNAIKSVSFESKKVDFSKSSWPKVKLKSSWKKTHIHVVVRRSKGWKLKEIRYYNADRKKTRKVKNLMSFKLTKNSKSYVTVIAEKNGKTVKGKVFVYKG